VIVESGGAPGAAREGNEGQGVDVFTAEQREQARARILAIARADPRVTAGALIGSMAAGAEDGWSDIDMTFAIVNDVSTEDVLRDWTAILDSEFGVLDHFDLRAGASVYRVLLLRSGLEVDVSVTPQQDFALRGSRVRALFGASREEPAAPQPDARYLIGLGWHHLIHARSSIERGKWWRAEYWISGLRDHILALTCLRMGEDAVYARGVDRLPPVITSPLRDTLVRSLDAPELRRALAAVTTAFLGEVEASDSMLAARLGALLLELGGAQPAGDGRESR
jgi:predicted nucleotidyltransferase